jgi:hypothetical protein
MQQPAVERRLADLHVQQRLDLVDELAEGVMVGRRPSVAQDVLRGAEDAVVRRRVALEEPAALRLVAMRLPEVLPVEPVPVQDVADVLHERRDVTVAVAPQGSRRIP